LKTNQFPELITLTDNDLLLAWDAETGTTRSVKSSTIKSYADPVNATALVSGTVAEYRFDELTGQQLTDYSGNSRHGVLGASNANTTQDPTVLSWLDSGLSFVTNQYISLPSYTWFAGNFYAEFVFMSRSNQAFSRLIDSNTVTNASTGLVVSASYNNNRPFLGFNGTNIQTSVDATLNKFHHLGVQLSGTAVSIFLNGILTGSGTIAVPSGTRGFTYLGKSNFTSDAYFDGIIAHLSIYNKILTNAERAKNFLAIKNRLQPKGILI
jgi:Concanavalin A-like lectin/glucanases superfamily